MLTKQHRELLEQFDKEAEAALVTGFDSGAAHWQHVREMARRGATREDLHAAFRGCWDDDVVDALLETRVIPATIEA